MVLGQSFHVSIGVLDILLCISVTCIILLGAGFIFIYSKYFPFGLKRYKELILLIFIAIRVGL